MLLEELEDNTEVAEQIGPLTPSPSSQPTGPGFEFDVFLSFRGADTRMGFTGHLYEALELRGVSTFIDSDKLEKGEEINELFQYMERSKICVPIFSECYAESKWCLKEVTKSVECRKEIIPVFFGVEPSDVRNQTGPFRSAFEEHEKKLNQEEVRNWREALKKVGSLSGFTLKDMNGDEAKLKLAIVKRVLSKVNKMALEVAKHPIGIETRVEDVKRILESRKNDVHVVGIQGMGGIGKTTIAKAVYNELIEGFNNASCFISNIREKSGPQNLGLVDLQKQFIGDVLKEKDTSLSDVAQGKVLIRKRVNRKRVLLVLDDVDSVEQLDALAGGRDWFGSGSVIIITTRNEEVLLAGNVKQGEIYKPEKLNEAQSRQLFILHAFNGGRQPQGEFVNLSNEVVAAAGGLPLTLEVIGSLLSSKKNVQEWKDTLEELRRIPPNEVQQKLKLSYDSLNRLQKKIFLDISCFFIGWGRQRATYMWEDCRWCPSAAIRVLVQKSLVKIDEESQEFEMHDQIRDMGRAIVDEESSGKPQKQSRLWNSQDCLDFLQGKVPGTIDAEGLRIGPNEKRFYGESVSARCFGEMRNLRYLNAKHVNFHGIFQSFPALKWLQLNNCHFDSPPSGFNLNMAVILDIYKTNIAQILINQLTKAGKAFERLKVLSIGGAGVTTTPDFMNIPFLIKLTLEECPALTSINDSMGKLKNLDYFCIKECPILEKLPDSICQLSSLKVLRIISCSVISHLPEELEDLESLMQLDIYGVDIKQIPESIRELSKLRELSVVRCRDLSMLPDSICQLSSLNVLDLRGCSALASLPERLGDMGSLRKLFLSEAGIVKIPNSIGQLISLCELHMIQCTRLSMLPDSICRITSLEILDLHSCFGLTSLPELLGDMRSLKKLVLSRTSIEKIPDSIGQLINLCELLMSGCQRLSRLPDSICQLSSLETLDLEWCTKLSSIPNQLGEMQSLKKLELTLTCIETIPDSIGQLTNLCLLSLQCSACLRGLPDSICQLNLLESLNLGGCFYLCSLPERLGDMEKLKELILDGTRIQALPDSVGRLKNLCLLSLEDCKSLKALPNSIRELSCLQHIKMSGTNLRGSESGSSHLAASAEVSFSSSGQLLGLSGTNLRGSESGTSHLAASAEVTFSSFDQLLGLSRTNLRGSESGTSNLAALAEVTVSTSKLLDLSDESRKALKHLHLADTRTEELPNCIKRMRNLEELLLECEMLRVLPNWIERFSEKLTKLEVSSKELQALPDCIGTLKQLKKFSLECENLQALPGSIGGLEILGRLKIESANLRALPFSIASLGRLQYLWLRCTSLEALPDPVGELKELEHFEVWSDSLKALPDSIGSLRKVSIFKLKCPKLEALPDSIGNLESLLFFEVRSDGLKYLPKSIGSLKRIQYLLLNCMNLEALPGSMETLESLKDLKLHCNKLMVPPDFIGRLENLVKFSFRSKKLKQLPATIESLGSLRSLSLRGCENLDEVTGFADLSSLQSLDLSYCKSLEYIPQLPSSLLWLDAANCTNLRKTSDVSHLKALENLNLRGCKLLEDVPGLEHITNKLEVLGLPGPCDLVGCCHLSNDFKRRVLKNKEVTFGSLKEFEMSGSVVRGSSTGQQQLHFMLPRLPFSWLRGVQLSLGLDKVVSPVHVAIMADDTIVFQKIVEVEGTTIKLNLGEESFMNTGERKGEHCFTMQVIADVSELQDAMAILQYLNDFRFLSQHLF